MNLSTPARAIAATRLIRSWVAILVGLYPALVLTTAAGGLILGAATGNPLTLAAMVGAATLYAMVFAIPVAAISAVLALPLLAFQRFIVSPERPYLRPGYAVVAIYGPALAILLQGGWDPSLWAVIIPYEATALIATLIYVRLAEPLELFAAP